MASVGLGPSGLEGISCQGGVLPGMVGKAGAGWGYARVVVVVRERRAERRVKECIVGGGGDIGAGKSNLEVEMRLVLRRRIEVGSVLFEATKLSSKPPFIRFQLSPAIDQLTTPNAKWNQLPCSIESQCC